MIPRWMRAAGLLVLVAPTAALAFETVDSLTFPSAGVFPAWGGDTAASPLSLFAYGGLMYDNNALRRSTGEVSDVVTRLGAGARYTARVIGRQRLTLEGFGEYYDYDRFDAIDHFGYGLRGDWAWEIGNNINGDALYERRRRHAALGEFRRESRAMVTSDRVLLDGGYRFHPDWRIFAGAEHTRFKREAEDAEDRAEVQSNSGRVNLTYSTPLGNAIGIDLRVSRGDTGFVDEVTGLDVTDEFDERTIAATFAYRLGAQLRLGGRIGRTERDYEAGTVEDFRGSTYSARVEWLPTGKLLFNFDFFRQPTSLVDIAATQVLRTGFDFGVSWAPTYKLVFTAHFTRERRELEGAAEAVPDTALRDDLLRTWHFGAGWEPMRHLQLGAGLDFGTRRSNVLGRDYDYTQVMANARWAF
jgi:hypothetical protein